MTEKMTGTAIKRIILRRIRNAEVPLAPRNEQNRIVEKIEELFSFATQIEEAVEKATNRVETLEQAILNKLRDALEKRINEVPWRKTNYIEPHEYIVKKNCPELWDDIARAIDQYGYTKIFKGALYKYLDIGPYRYWHFKLVLNRALHNAEPV